MGPYHKALIFVLQTHGRWCCAFEAYINSHSLVSFVQGHVRMDLCHPLYRVFTDTLMYRPKEEILCTNLKFMAMFISGYFDTSELLQQLYFVFS